MARWIEGIGIVGVALLATLVSASWVRLADTPWLAAGYVFPALGFACGWGLGYRQFVPQAGAAAPSSPAGSDAAAPPPATWPLIPRRLRRRLTTAILLGAPLAGCALAGGQDAWLAWGRQYLADLPVFFLPLAGLALGYGPFYLHALAESPPPPTAYPSAPQFGTSSYASSPYASPPQFGTPPFPSTVQFGAPSYPLPLNPGPTRADEVRAVVALLGLTALALALHAVRFPQAAVIALSGAAAIPCGGEVLRGVAVGEGLSLESHWGGLGGGMGGWRASPLTASAGLAVFFSTVAVIAAIGWPAPPPDPAKPPGASPPTAASTTTTTTTTHAATPER